MKNQFICQVDLAQNRVLRCIIYVLPAAPIFELSGSILWQLMHESIRVLGPILPLTQKPS